MLRAVVLVASVLSLTALGGCGLGAGEELGGGVELRVTRDFGQERLASVTRDEVREGDTVMRLLQSERDVETEYGGGFVQSIDGLSGEGADGRSDWFYFVNGLEADVGAADHGVAPGDVIQWDYRYWDAAMRVPAIVGAYPEPFLHGTEGERLPTRVECAEESSSACGEVKDRLADAGVTVTSAPFGTAAGPEVLRVVVGPWTDVRGIRAAQKIEEGPEASGVFARFSSDGAELALLDEHGSEVETEGAGAGLVAAVELLEQQPVWVVTGVDEAGVDAAAETLEEETLRDLFAVAATPEGPVSLPVTDGEAVASASDTAPLGNAFEAAAAERRVAG